MISYEEWRKHPYVGWTFEGQRVELSFEERFDNQDKYEWISYNTGKNHEYDEYVAMYTNRNKYFC